MQRGILSFATVFAFVCFAIPPAFGVKNASDDHCKRGIALDAKGEHDKAIVEYSEAIRLDPRSVLAYNGRGVAWAKQGQYDKAMTDFDEAVRINPNFAYTYNSRGAVWASKREYDKAIADGCNPVLRAAHVWSMGRDEGRKVGC